MAGVGLTGTSIEQLAAHLEIERALVVYCRGVDRGDPALIREAFHPDAIDEHGPFVGLGWELAERLAFQAIPEPERGGHHQLTNVYIELDSASSARAESYVMAYHPVRGEDGTDQMLVFSGRYLDRFECRDGKWKIAARQVICDWHEYRPLHEPMPGYPVGRKGPGRDPSYDMFPPRRRRRLLDGDRVQRRADAAGDLEGAGDQLELVDAVVRTVGGQGAEIPQFSKHQSHVP